MALGNFLSDQTSLSVNREVNVSIPAPFLSFNFEYFPDSLHDSLVGDEALSPAWAHFIEREDTIAALQIAEAELESAANCEHISLALLGLYETQVGVTYLANGRPDIAETFFSEAYPHLKTLPDDDSKPFVRLASIWIQTLIELGRTDEAEAPFIEICDRMERLRASTPLDEQKEVTLGWIALLGELINTSCKHEQVKFGTQLFENAISNMLLIYSPGSYEILCARETLASLYQNLGEMNRCNAESVAVQAGFEALGNTHDDHYIKATLRNANTALTEGRYCDALLAVRKVRPNLDPESPNYAFSLYMTYVIRAQVAYQGSANPERTIENYQRGLAALEEDGFDPSYRLEEMELIATYLCKFDMQEEEEKLLRSMLSLSETVFGEKDERSFEGRRKLISFYDRAEKFSACHDECSNYLDLCKKHYGIESFVFIEALTEYGAFKIADNDPLNGRRTLYTALGLARKHLALPERTIILEILKGLGDFYENQDDYKNALRCRKIAARLAFQYRGPNGIELGDAYFELADTLHSADRYEGAKEYVLKAQRIYEGEEGDLVSVAKALALGGFIKLCEGDPECAERLLEQARKYLKVESAITSSTGVKVLERLGTSILEQTDVIPDLLRQRQALGYLVSADTIAAELQIKEGYTDFVRRLRIYEAAQALGQGHSDLAKHYDFIVTRMQLAGYGVGDGSGPAETSEV